MAPGSPHPRLPYLPILQEVVESEEYLLLSHAQRGIHLDLMWYAWRHGGSLPADLGMVALLLGRMPRDELEAIWGPLERLWPADGDRRRNAYITKELERIHTYRVSQSESGRRGAEARWARHGEPMGSPSRPNGFAIGEKWPPIPIPIPIPGKEHPPSGTSTTGCTGDLRDAERVGGAAPRMEGGGEGLGRAGFDVLFQIGYRDKSGTQSADILAALRKFSAEGGTTPDLQKLAARAKRKGKNPAALLARWIDRSDWQKELSKRS